VYDAFKVLPQYALPKRALTEFVGHFARKEGGTRTHDAIRRFVARYSVDMSEAANPDIASYATFNSFFTRPLRDGARPLATAPFVCPVDGAISQFGDIDRDQIFQAKGHRYSITALVGGDAVLAKAFEGGLFATLYLSPRDYHRIHMPVTGRLVRMRYVPGALFSVNPTTARAVPGLFARNERVVCLFESDIAGKAAVPWVLVLVGATIVGSMATVWHGVVNPPRSRQVREWRYPDGCDGGAVRIGKGAEMGRFLLGSTVVLLYTKGSFRFNPEWTPGRAVRMGEAMGY
jgi:phosphatidylserine decarboxylase